MTKRLSAAGLAALILLASPGERAWSLVAAPRAPRLIRGVRLAPASAFSPAQASKAAAPSVKLRAAVSPGPAPARLPAAPLRLQPAPDRPFGPQPLLRQMAEELGRTALSGGDGEEGRAVLERAFDSSGARPAPAVSVLEAAGSEAKAGLTAGKKRPGESSGGPPPRRSWYRVLSDPQRNRDFWKYTIIQGLIQVGGNFHYTALPKLSGDGIYNNRAGNYAVQGAASLMTAPLIDRYAANKTMAATFLGRGLLMLAVPAVFFWSELTPGRFLAVIAAAGFLQSAGLTAGSVAFNRIIGADSTEYNRANAVHNLVLNIVGIGAPLLAAAFFAAAGPRLKEGALGAAALSYAVYGAVLLGGAAISFFRLKLPAVAEAGARAKSGVGRAFKDAVQGFSLMWRNGYLRRYLLFGTLSLMSSEALVFGALNGLLDAKYKSVPGAFGFFLSASSLGLGLAAVIMTFMKGKDLERQGKWSSILHGIGWLFYLGAFFSGKLWLSIGSIFAVMLLQGVRMVVWGSLHQKVLGETFPADMGKVYSAMSVYQLGAAMTGLLLFGGLVAPLGLAVMLKVAALIVVLCAAADVLAPFFIFPLKR